jgi:hypothetical protein
MRGDVATSKREREDAAESADVGLFVQRST